MSSRDLTVMSLLAFAVVTTAGAEAPMTVGERFPILISPTAESQLEASPTERGRAWTLYHPGATYLAPHFERFDLGPGETLVVSDGHGAQTYTLQGKGKMDAGTFWSRHVKGDTLVMELVGSNPTSSEVDSNAPGFVVDEYAAGYVNLGGTEAICGADDKKNAICYASSHSTEYDRARAVARLLIMGSSLCTGWLVSADNHLLTNEHCITSSTAALNTDYEFMAEAPNCSDANCQLCWDGTVFSGATFIQDDAGLDYALVQIPSGNPAASYGFLQIDDRAAVPGEQIYIPQHPGGRAKELGIESSDSHDGGGVCRVYSTSEPPCAGSGYNDVGYFCDTEGGSSGSPVLASSSHKVIALHHCALCPNRGVPIDLVYAEISQYLGSCGDGSCSVGEDPCSCPADCGSPPTSETDCSDGVDNDCDDLTDCDDADCTGDPACVCDGDGVCEIGEDCTNCSTDCISGTGGAVCGNGLCEAGDGEDCRTCSADCNGRTTGPPSGRFCCGAGGSCADSRCNDGSWMCTTTPQTQPYCCGDGLCQGAETFANCGVDCAASFCGDGTCDPGEDSCSCASDCGSPPFSEIPGLSCQDGRDNDCDGSADCADSDCDGDPACECGVKGDPCTTGADCCSGSCHQVKKTCK